jgi:arsenate reductase
MVMPDPIRVLILCTHNSARSQIAEAMLRQLGGPEFVVESAGSEATAVNPLAMRALEEAGYRTDGLYSKALKRFLGEHFDVVLTACDLANESCPIFPGTPRRVHWSLPDPSVVQGSEEESLSAFRSVRDELAVRLPPFIVAQRHQRDAGSQKSV